jgi:hypothetical protein
MRHPAYETDRSLQSARSLAAVRGMTGMIGEAVVTVAAVQVGYLLGVLVAAHTT